MGWKMLVFVAFVQLVCVSASVPQMSLVREWESVELLVPGDGGQGTSRRPLSLYDDTNGTIIDIWLLAVYKDGLFVGVRTNRAPAPFNLAYHNLSDTSKSLLLQPYPSWDAHSDKHGDRLIHDVLALRADRCNRLWVIDGVDDVNEHRIIVIDLNTDRFLRQHTFSHSNDFLYHIAVDDVDCENPYLYISDRGQGGIWTYSWAEDTIWHHPGDIVTWMVLAPNVKSDYSIVYYNKEGYNKGVWYISTRYLRDKTSNLSEFEHRGGHDVYLIWTALDVKSNVLFVKTFDKSTPIRAFSCWNRYEWCDPSGKYDIAINTTHKVSQIILVKNGNLWVLTRREPFEDSQISLSIFSVPITSANLEFNKNDTTNTVPLNETASPATDPATNMTVQASGVDFDRISNTTVTIEDTIAGTPNSDITGVDYYDTYNTTVTIEETPAVTPNSTITATDPVSCTKMQASGVDYDRNSNTTATAEVTIVGTPNSDINTQANDGNKMSQFANIVFSFTNSSLIFSNFTVVNYSPSNNVN